MGKTKENPRYRVLSARMSEEELSAIWDRAKFLGFATYSDYVRDLVERDMKR